MSALLDARTATEAIAGLRTGPDPEPLAVLAAGAWSAMAEPGDGVAGAFVSALGAAEALESVVLDAPPSQNPALLAGFARWRARLDPEALLRAFAAARTLGARLLVPGDPDWPDGLADLGVHAPLALWVRGPAGPLPDLARSVAVVGARDATPYGLRATADLACGLADRGFAIVSGAAAGIDGAAHRAALASGALTAAVLAGGPDRLYPAEHATLLQRIIEAGVVLAEMPCGATPMRQRFLSRNRLIAAITRATVVVEAGVPSGAINTAAHAAQLGRPLGAVPGSVYSAASAGCHRLLREYDAVAIRTPADAAELARDRDAAVPLDGVDRVLDPQEQRVLEALGRTPRPSERIAQAAGLPVPDVRSALALLALDGAAIESGRGWVRA